MTESDLSELPDNRPSRLSLTGGRFAAFVAFSLLAWAAAAAICLCFGPGGSLRLELGDRLVTLLSPSLLKLRLGRVLAASLIGAGLAAAGVTFQALLRNPLASPYILGISSGATVGVVVGLYVALAFPNSILAQAPQHVLALAFGVATIGLVYLLARRRGQLDPLTLLLVGVMVTAFNGAVIMVFNLMVPGGIRGDFVVWMMGMVSENVRWSTLGWVAAGIGAGIAVMLALAQQFNLQSLGEQTARTLGVRLQRLRVVSFFVASGVTALAVSISGPIGFVGLICPHICRRLFGPDHRVLMVTATAFGAIFLLAADTLVRTVAPSTGGEVPVGVVTALFGGPFFIYLLRRHYARRLSE
ncbi:MAG: Hemin transport system permease protein HmuU [Phycisphaerae bacterium]|nr:Hemin transport system permease protein HmuU [Phycisphaerae bacterium]